MTAGLPMSIVNYPLMAAGFLLDLYENESIRRQSRHVCDCDYSIQLSLRTGSAWSLTSLRFMVLLRYVNKESEELRFMQIKIVTFDLHKFIDKNATLYNNKIVLWIYIKITVLHKLRMIEEVRHVLYKNHRANDKEDQRNFSGIDSDRTSSGRQNHIIDKTGREGSQNRFPG